MNYIIAKAQDNPGFYVIPSELYQVFKDITTGGQSRQLRIKGSTHKEVEAQMDNLLKTTLLIVRDAAYCGPFKPINAPDYHRLLSMIYHGTGFEVSWHNREGDVIPIIKAWHEESLK